MLLGDHVSYAGDVGSRLRQLRAQQGLSLQDVERKSNGEWKAAVVGSYERGDRNISAARLHFQAVLANLETMVRAHPFLWFNFLPLNPEARSAA